MRSGQSTQNQVIAIFQNRKPVTITKTNGFWIDQHLSVEVTVRAALTLSSTNQPITNSRLPPSLPNTWQDNIDHERHPQGNSTILLLFDMETLVKHQTLEAEGTCVSVDEQISAGDWKQHQSPKVPASGKQSCHCTKLNQWWKYPHPLLRSSNTILWKKILHNNEKSRIQNIT